MLLWLPNDNTHLSWITLPGASLASCWRTLDPFRFVFHLPFVYRLPHLYRYIANYVYESMINKRGGAGGEKEEKRRLMCKNHLSFVSAAAGGCKFPFGSSFSFRFPLIVITPSCSLFALGSRSLHFVINFSLLICNILATLYTLNFSNNPLRKSQCIRLSHFLMNVFKLGKPEYFLPISVTASSIKICDIYLISKTSE